MSYDVFARKDVPFGGCIDTAPHLAVKLPKNPNFGVWIGISKPNAQNIQLLYYKNCWMYSNQILSDDKDLQVLLVGCLKNVPHKSKTADNCHL